MAPQWPAQERRGDITRRALFAAAEAAFARLGYHGASIEAIVKEAGYGLGTFYLYFQSKVVAFQYVLQTRQQQWIEETARAADGAPDERTALERGLVAYFTWIAKRPALLRLVREAEFVDPELFAGVYLTPTRWFADELANAMAAGILPHEDPEVLAWSVIALTEFATLTSLVWGEAEVGDSRRMDAFMRIVVRTLGLDAA